MEFVPLLALGLLLKKVLDWLRTLIPTDYHTKVLIPISLALGVGLALLFSASEALGGSVTIFTHADGTVYTLANADVYLVVVFGLFVGAGAGVIHDALKPTTPPHDNTVGPHA